MLGLSFIAQQGRPMLTLYHAPQSRCSRIINLLMALDALDRVDIRLTDIPR